MVARRVNEGKGSSSFLKKEQKNFCSWRVALNWPFKNVCWRELVKVFCFFFSKKKNFLPCFTQPRMTNGCLIAPGGVVSVRLERGQLAACLIKNRRHNASNLLAPMG